MMSCRRPSTASWNAPSAIKNVKVLDRTALILDIFAQHARTREGALQVELAQYEYRLPRLTRAWTHLARQAGGAAGRGGTGGVGLRGPGETQLEVDRREIGKRITHLKHELEEVRAHRANFRRRRFEEADPGRGARRLHQRRQIHPAQRAQRRGCLRRRPALRHPRSHHAPRGRSPAAGEVLITDTVGFIQKLPTALVAAFRATLEEIAEADLILHVVDITHNNVQEQVATVLKVLAELDATSQPIVTALNKMDRLPPLDAPAALIGDLPNSVPVSALTGEGVPALVARIEEVLTEELVDLALLLPYQRGDLLGLFHQRGVIEREEHGPEGTRLWGKAPARLAGRFHAYRWPPVVSEDEV